MTTEIAVLNRLGVALATDSAVTISSESKSKVFPTGDKLFELCAQHPIAIMINGNMELAGVPLEIVIKDFRAHAASLESAKIDDWAERFLKFAEAHELHNNHSEADFIIGTAVAEIEAIKAAAQRKAFDAYSTDPSPDIEQLVNDVIAERIAFYDEAGAAESVKELTQRETWKRYGLGLNHLLNTRFQPVELSQPTKRRLRRLLFRMLVSRRPSDFYTGIIVAGFAADEMFPSICVAEIDGVVCGKLKYTITDTISVDRRKYRGGVISFAQTDVIDRILGGADTKFIARSKEYIGQAFEATKAAVVAAFENAGLPVQDAEAIFGDLVNVVGNNYEKKFAKDARDDFQRDFNGMIAMMPKSELIELAEAFVSITAIERKASSEQATVGGPVDVAFITKHDGFVWIKRKHYFPQALNPRYFWRKYGKPSLTENGDVQGGAESG